MSFPTRRPADYDASEKKSEFYWKNDDLVPDARKKGGVK